MTDIKIPHEYLPALLRMRAGSIIPSDMDKVDEFIAAAEADQPPLPEPAGLGSVVRASCVHTSVRGLYVKRERNSWIALPGYYDRTMQQQSDAWADLCDVEVLLDTDTPLRPTVTEADIEKATEAALSDLEMPGGHPGGGLFQTAKGTIRAAFKAAGIEVQS